MALKAERREAEVIAKLADSAFIILTEVNSNADSNKRIAKRLASYSQAVISVLKDAAIKDFQICLDYQTDGRLQLLVDVHPEQWFDWRANKCLQKDLDHDLIRKGKEYISQMLTAAASEILQHQDSSENPQERDVKNTGAYKVDDTHKSNVLFDDEKVKFIASASGDKTCEVVLLPATHETNAQLVAAAYFWRALATTRAHLCAKSDNMATAVRYATLNFGNWETNAASNDELECHGHCRMQLRLDAQEKLYKVYNELAGCRGSRKSYKPEHARIMEDCLAEPKWPQADSQEAIVIDQSLFNKHVPQPESTLTEDDSESKSCIASFDGNEQSGAADESMVTPEISTTCSEEEEAAFPQDGPSTEVLPAVKNMDMSDLEAGGSHMAGPLKVGCDSGAIDDLGRLYKEMEID